MNRMKNFAYAHRRLLAALVFVLFACVFVTGVVRFLDYTLPMVRGDYEYAATYKSRYVGPPGDMPPIPGLNEDPPLSERALEWVLDRSNEYRDLTVGSRALAAFDQGLSLYQDGKELAARSALQKAFAACCDGSGKMLPGYEKLGSDIQLLIGNTFANQQKTEDAVAAYEISLTLDPDNIVTTYNLERLQDSSGGGGADKPDNKGNPQPQGPASPRKRI